MSEEEQEQEFEADDLEEMRVEAAEPDQAPPDQHILQRAVVFEELRTLYVPVPKAGCTAILWSLAELSGLNEDRFYGSFGREVSRSLTIHDLNQWPDQYLYGKLPKEKRDEILAADDWLRFTVVRHPFRRLWSAWQSKILLNEPQFTEKFSEESWFPHSVDSAGDVLKMFRQFLQALEENPPLVSADVHWAPQVALAAYSEMPYTFVGRVEKLGETVDLLRDHLQKVNGSTLPDLPRANVTPLPYVDELFDEGDARILGEAFADDLREFDYKPPPGSSLEAPCPPSWTQAVDAVTPALEELRHRNERVGDLQRLFKEKRSELNGRINHMRDRIGNQKERLEQQKARIAEAKRRNQHQAKLRAEEQRRNERLQKRLLKTTNELARIKNSASWRYTAPLRRLTRFGKKATGRKKSD